MTFADIVVFAIRLYQRTLSPILGFVTGPSCGCRFTPSCSQYAIGALRQHGTIAGGWLALKRICRCHPWGGCGHDPVPPAVTNHNPKFAIFARHGS